MIQLVNYKAEIVLAILLTGLAAAGNPGKGALTLKYEVTASLSPLLVSLVYMSLHNISLALGFSMSSILTAGVITMRGLVL